METKVNYAVVGLFVLLLGAALVAGVLWLSAGKQYRKTYDTYYTYMRESVSGLNLNAPVKYRGVEVGQVREISLNPANVEQVRLVLDIERNTPVKEDSVAVLKVQGLTGIAYVDLSGGSRESPLLKAREKGAPPVIKSGVSLLARLDTALTNLLTNLNRTSENMNAVLDSDNRRALKQTLANLEVLSSALAARRSAIDAGIANTARASAGLPQLIEHVDHAAATIQKMAENLTRTSDRTFKTVESVSGEVHRFSNESQPELEQALREIRDLTASMKRVSEQLEQNPAALLYGKQPAQPGPGE